MFIVNKKCPNCGTPCKKYFPQVVLDGEVDLDIFEPKLSVGELGYLISYVVDEEFKCDSCKSIFLRCLDGNWLVSHTSEVFSFNVQG